MQSTMPASTMVMVMVKYIGAYTKVMVMVMVRVSTIERAREHHLPWESVPT